MTLEQMQWINSISYKKTDYLCISTIINNYMSDRNIELRKDFISDIKQIISSARTSAIRSVDFERVRMYWRLGERIFVEEQEGKERAEYGSFLIHNLSASIEPEFGSGFSYRQLAFCRQFYRTYPNMNALRSQFNWSQYFNTPYSLYRLSRVFN